MSTEKLACIELNPPTPTPATASIIWMHGLGADGNDFVSLVPELRLPADLAVRFIFPHAPVRPVTINNGYPMRAWYDITAITPNAPQDAAGIHASEHAINALIAQEIARGVLAERIILAGFSQGGAMALHCGLRYPQRLAGILALSCYLPLALNFPQEANSVNRDVSIFMAHGNSDTLLPLAMGRAAADFLLHLGYALEFHTYPMAHGVCQQEVVDIAAWIKRIFRI